MSMSAEVHDTILSFCIENNIPQDKAIALLREIVDDMNGDGDNYDFSFVANVYASSKQAAQQERAADTSPLCPECLIELHLTTAGEFVCRNEACGLYR